MSPPTGIVVEVEMNYTQVVNCTSPPGNNDKTGVQSKIRQTVGEKADSLPCVGKGTCEVESVEVKVCEAETPTNGRGKRSTPDLSKPTINIKLRRRISGQGKFWCLKLSKAMSKCLKSWTLIPADTYNAVEDAQPP